MMTSNPALILLFSGKRKSGKDYITDLLHQRLGDKSSVIIRLSGPIKQQYAADHGLDYSHLLTASDYKEKYRLPMISWSEAKRAEDSGFFIRAAITMYNGVEYPVWVVSDLRRESDLAWFRQHYPDILYTVRVKASPQIREQRGWVFTQGVDDAESECGLDGVSDWDLEVDNSEHGEAVDAALTNIHNRCLKHLTPSPKVSPQS